jgi:hypothetical protein
MADNPKFAIDLAKFDFWKFEFSNCKRSLRHCRPSAA